MKQVFINKLKVFLGLALILSVIWGTAQAQDKDTEPAKNSTLVGTTLPANARRALPQSVPAEITETLQKFVAAGEGRLRQGETEVLVWGGADFKKSNAPQITGKLRAAWEADGWTYEIGGEEQGITVFSIMKEGSVRRAIVGFYGATDEAFVLAMTELLKNDETEKTARRDQKSPSEMTETQTKGEKPRR